MLAPTSKDTALNTVTVSRPSRQSGFSLIEIMVVILIIGLGVRFISINVGGTKTKQIRQEAKLFVNATSLAAEEAVLSRQQWGVDFYREAGGDGDLYGYRWLVRVEGRWQLAEPQDNQEQEVLFSPGVQLRLEFDEIEQDIEFKKEIPEIVTKDEADFEQRLHQSIEQSNEKVIEPHIWLLSSGEMTAFSLFIVNPEDSENEISISGDELGRVTINTGRQDEE
ncbi:MAG: prepilin-type N-terminal cleavage/methylation domain-containing protein [Spongiibacteraceae bacterium]|nr:prepilin-type N-terminal cleavage/methylation domain-containing protein [Spongiibacteraceae bacterium]